MKQSFYSSQNESVLYRFNPPWANLQIKLSGFYMLEAFLLNGLNKRKHLKLRIKNRINENEKFNIFRCYSLPVFYKTTLVIIKVSHKNAHDRVFLYVTIRARPWHPTTKNSPLIVAWNFSDIFENCFFRVQFSETCLGPYQASMMEIYCENIFAKSFIIDVWWSPKYVSDFEKGHLKLVVIS